MDAVHACVPDSQVGGDDACVPDSQVGGDDACVPDSQVGGEWVSVIKGADQAIVLVVHISGAALTTGLEHLLTHLLLPVSTP